MTLPSFNIKDGTVILASVNRLTVRGGHLDSDAAGNWYGDLDVSELKEHIAPDSRATLELIDESGARWQCLATLSLDSRWGEHLGHLLFQVIGNPEKD